MYAYAANNPVRYIDPDGRENWQPLTYKTLWRLAFQSGNLKGRETVKNNQIVGKAFEKAVGQIIGQNKNTKEFYSVERSSGVIPDFVRSLNVLGVSEEGIKLLDMYPTGVFIEVKTSQTIDLNGSTQKQIMAMIDACSKQYSINNNISGKDGVATMFLITLSDTKISKDVIDYAIKKHVILYQFTALYDKDCSSKIKLSAGKMITIPINRSILPEPIKHENGFGYLDF